jgi:hypothetical protein
MLAFISAVWISYSILGLGQEYGKDSMTLAYAFLGVGSVGGSFIFAGVSRHLTMRGIALVGVSLTIVGLITQLIPTLAIIAIGMLLASLGNEMMTHPVILSRQLLMKGHGLARFTGYSRLAFAICGATGSWVGWLVSSHRPALILISLGGCLVFLAAARFLVHTRPTSQARKVI